MKRGIVEIVQGIERAYASRTRGYVFRGEPACFEKVSSSLFRTYGLEKGDGDFSIQAIEDEMVEKARAFTDRNDPFDILCEIQHRGGRTNQIDFTRDLGVALFFACGTASGKEQEPGRVIMLGVSDSAMKSGISVRDITHPIHMAAAQKSVFVSTDTGYLDDRHIPHMQIWTIDADEKQDVLQYLKSSRGIDSRSIFMDISGFIRNAHEFESANAWYSRANKTLAQGDCDGAIEAASNYLRLAGSGRSARPGLYLRGHAYYRKGDRARAFRDLRRTMGVMHGVNRRIRKIFQRFGPTEWPAYPLPDDIQKELVEWCGEQERIEEEARQRQKQTEEEDRRRREELQGAVSRQLQCVISASHMEGAPDPSVFAFSVLTDSGYHYRQSLGQAAKTLMTFPDYFLDYEAACWWSFYGNEYQHIFPPKKTVAEDFEAVVLPKPGSSAPPSTVTVTVRFFAYDASKQELKETDSGEYELASLTPAEGEKA